MYLQYFSIQFYKIKYFQDFQAVAYKASERRELLSAINEILDFSIVMPPGDYENQSLLPYTDIKEKTDEIRRRQSRMLHPSKPRKLRFVV